MAKVRVTVKVMVTSKVRIGILDTVRVRVRGSPLSRGSKAAVGNGQG